MVVVVVMMILSSVSRMSTEEGKMDGMGGKKKNEDRI